MTVNGKTRKLVRERANYLCEYCHSLEEASAAQFAIDHIVPQSLAGTDEPDNLALACQRCNGYRYNFTTGFDPQTQAIISLFNPRQQKWAEHFIWTADGLQIMALLPLVGLPAIGSISTMNDIMKARFRKLVVCGCEVVGIHRRKTHNKKVRNNIAPRDPFEPPTTTRV